LCNDRARAGTETLRYVDQSVQPGDGGWGLVREAHAVRQVKGAFLFASGSYLANPKATNDTPSIISAWNFPSRPGSSQDWP
jgi:hypothetical protein